MAGPVFGEQARHHRGSDGASPSHGRIRRVSWEGEPPGEPAANGGSDGASPSHGRFRRVSSEGEPPGEPAANGGSDGASPSRSAWQSIPSREGEAPAKPELSEALREAPPSPRVSRPRRLPDHRSQAAGQARRPTVGPVARSGDLATARSPPLVIMFARIAIGDRTVYGNLSKYALLSDAATASCLPSGLQASP